MNEFRLLGRCMPRRTELELGDRGDWSDEG